MEEQKDQKTEEKNAQNVEQKAAGQEENSQPESHQQPQEKPKEESKQSKRIHEHIYGFHLYAFGLLRKLYDWVLSWAHTKYGWAALFLLAFVEASFFPIPPDVLLIALCVSVPGHAFRYATLATIGSVAGGVLGYYIGYAFYESIGVMIIDAFHYHEQFEAVGDLYSANAFWSLVAAGFTPLPYKVFTIAAGVWKIELLTLIGASLISRAGRFFLVAGLLYFFGPKMKEIIDKYFNLLTVLFFILLVGGFVVIKIVL